MRTRPLYLFYHSNALLNENQDEKMVLNFIQNRIGYVLNRYNCIFIRIHKQNLIKSIPSDTHSPELAVEISLENPLLDMTLMENMIDMATESKMLIKSNGAVPGTSPLLVGQIESLRNNNPFITIYSEMQRHYNSQLNISRNRRFKMFKIFLKHFPNLYKMSVKNILDFCSSRKGTEFIISHGIPSDLIHTNKCPLCKSKEFHALYADIGQPVIGFLTRFSKYYYLCHNCGLVFLNPYLPKSKLQRYYDRYMRESERNIEQLNNHYRNLSHLNTSHYYNYSSILSYVSKLPPKAKIADLGGGDGEFAVYIKRKYSDFNVTLMDFQISKIVKNALHLYGVHVKEGDITDLTLPSESFDLITNWEVIEHLPIELITLYFKNLYSALKKNGLYIFSTPDFSSPYSNALDFWAMAPGEHLSVFSRKVLEPILTNCGFSIIDEKHECVTMKMKDRWFKYGEETNSFMAARGEAYIINTLLKDDLVINNHLDYLRKNNMGSEIILVCKK